MARGTAGRDWQNDAGARLVAIIAVAVLGVVAVGTAALALGRDTGVDEGATAAPVPTYGAGPTPTPTAATPSVVVIGDDFTSGTAQNTGPEWPALLGLDADVTAQGVAESGYLVGGADATFADRAAALPATTNVVVFLGGGDDPVAGLQAGVESAIAAARTAAPESRLIVVGPPWTGSPDAVAASMIARRDAVAAAASAAGVVFVDPIADGWFADRAGLVGTDGIHPTDAGHARIAERLRPVLQEATAPAA